MVKRIRRMLLFLIIIIAIVLGIKNLFAFSYRAEAVYHLKTKQDIDAMSILKGGVLATFDGDALVFYNSPDDFHVVDRMGEGQKAFFGEEDGMLYDEDTSKLTVFTPEGKEQVSYYLEGELFQAEVQGGLRILHCRFEDGEKLFVASNSGSLTSVFETKNYILDYRFDSEDRFVVTELSSSANGYKTTVYVHGKKEKAKFDSTEFPMEVAMHLTCADFPIVATEKHLYGLSEELITEKTPIISDIAVVKNKPYALHSGILSVYDKELKEVEQFMMEANVDRLANMDGKLFAYGNREILGNPETKHPYLLRFGDNQEKLILKHGYIAAYEHKKIVLYQLKPQLFRGEEEGQELSNES